MHEGQGKAGPGPDQPSRPNQAESSGQTTAIAGITDPVTVGLCTSDASDAGASDRQQELLPVLSWKEHDELEPAKQAKQASKPVTVVTSTLVPRKCSTC